MNVKGKLLMRSARIIGLTTLVMIAKRDSGLGRDYFPKAKTGELTL